MKNPDLQKLENYEKVQNIMYFWNQFLLHTCFLIKLP